MDPQRSVGLSVSDLAVGMCHSCSHCFKYLLYCMIRLRLWEQLYTPNLVTICERSLLAGSRILLNCGTDANRGDVV